MPVKAINEKEYKEIIRKFVLRILEEEFNGDEPDDEYFVQEICEISGMDRNTYMELMDLNDEISVNDLAVKLWEVMNEQNSDELYEGHPYLKEILDNTSDEDAVNSLVVILNRKDMIPKLKAWLEKYCEIADRGDDWYYLCSIAKRVMHYLDWMSNKRECEDAEIWLENRRKELSSLRFRVYDSELWPEEKEVLCKAGYFIYDLREWDEGNGYNIEVKTVANHIGNWVTDIDLTPYMNEGTWIGIDELRDTKFESIPYDEIKHLLQEGRKLHGKNMTESGVAIAY